jgi:hypothetical protein
VFIQYLQTRCVLPVDLHMDQIILTCAAIIDFPVAKHFKYTSLVWNSNQINRAVFFVFFCHRQFQGRIQDFRVKNHDYTPKNHMFFNCRGRRENFWGISCEKSRFYAKKSYFFPILGGAFNTRKNTIFIHI